MQRVSAPPRLPPRPADAHKASAGRVLVAGGSADLCGAPAMAALGALRGGAGLVRVAVPAGIRAVVAGFRPETTSAALPETRAGGIAPEALERLHALAREQDAVVLGPGAGREEATLEALRAFTLAVDRPLVLDADALFAFDERLDALAGRSAPTVLTPHEGEAARLLGVSASEVRADRPATAARLARESGAVVVLKGPGTLVVDDARLYRNETGGPWLASGGTGDVLAGVVGALLAWRDEAGLDVFSAVCVAVHAHGAAADSAAAGRGRGVLATDVAACLPAALRAMEEA
jgi:NAD(P)H-hydrate epimerase